MGPGPERLLLISMSQIKTGEINSVNVSSLRIPRDRSPGSGTGRTQDRGVSNLSGTKH